MVTNKNEKLLQSADIEQDKCEETENRLLQAINESNLNLRELTFVLAHLFIDIGGSLEGNDTVLTQTVIRRMYLEEPTLGRALMCMGADMLADWLELPMMPQVESEKNG